MAEHMRLAECSKHMEETMNSDFHDLARDLSEQWAQEVQHREERIIARIVPMMEERRSEATREKNDLDDQGTDLRART